MAKNVKPGTYMVKKQSNVNPVAVLKKAPIKGVIKNKPKSSTPATSAMTYQRQDAQKKQGMC